MGFDVVAPYNEEAANNDDLAGEPTIERDDNPNGTLEMYWYGSATANECISPQLRCDYASSDEVFCYLERVGLTCSGAPYDFGVFSFRAQACTGPVCGVPFPPTCARWVDRNDLHFLVTKQRLGCPVPPVWKCGEGEQCSLGCTPGMGAGGGGGGAGGGGGPGDGFGPGASLAYLAGGAGHPGFPGTTAWNPVLGRYWSHDYAERIVVDPDEDHVWLITRWATFREFSKSSGETVYPTVSPSDEYRTLEKTASGWTLTDLDGTVTAFDGAGLWLSTTDRNGNAKTATYTAGELTSVEFPDGRREDFGYDGGGRLASITEVGVGGTDSRTWTYTWSGDDLQRIDRPDGTAWVFTYDDPAHPGYMTLMELEGTDGSRRVERGWEYDAEGNAMRTWKGAPSFSDPAAVDTWELAFDDPTLPTETTVTDPLGNVAIYTIGRDSVSPKPRVEAIAGDCPACGVGPNVQLVYGDAANPLRPTREIDGDGTETHFTYDGHGQVLTKTEAANTILARTTSWSYDPAYPALVTEIEQPSVDGVGLRRTTIGRNAAGDPETRTIEGSEAGVAFTYSTGTSFNGGGQPLSVDPPGYGTADVTGFAYDPARGNGQLVLDTRTDPLVGMTTFGYDGFNRRTEVTDPNGLLVETEYDELDRVTRTIQRGPSPSEDLVTEHVYGVFGDLVRTVLPRGNVIVYDYDDAGRLFAVERKPDPATPAERTLYTLDAAGQRIQEDLQSWDPGAAAWVTASTTSFLYTTRCHLDRVIHAGGTSTEYAYDCNGNLERVWDANHPRFPDDPPPPPPPPGDGDGAASTFAASHVEAPPTRIYAYDALDRLASVRQPWPEYATGWDDADFANEAVTDYGYDVQDHLTSVTDAEGNETTYEYSDRDLLIEEVSPVSGTTTHAYNEHGELIETVDARGILVTRTVDELDRVTFVDYPDPALDTEYDYDDPAVDHALGRLTEISRQGTTVAYAYDPFGRVTQDGGLGYGYDENGNRTEITYPGGVVVRYGFDFADRETTAELQVGADPPQPLVTAASYLPSGPLTSVALGNGLAEIRGFDARYRPTSISLSGLATLTYQTDAVGNVLAIDRTVGADVVPLTYAYQDGPYFLTEGSGPWGRGAWTYDRIGNRLTESPGGGDTDAGTTTYEYQTNPVGPAGAATALGNTPQLLRVELTPGDADGETGPSAYHYTYDAAGNQTSIQPVPAPFDGAGVLDYDDGSRLTGLGTDFGAASTAVIYDGRGFLATSETTVAGTSDVRLTEAHYATDGLLLARRHLVQTGGSAPGDGDEPTGGGGPSASDETTYLVYFAGRPLAQLTRDGLGVDPDRLLYLATDHLGTPIAATDPAGSAAWQGGLSPFGVPYTFAPPIGDGGDTDPPEEGGGDSDDPDAPTLPPPPPDPDDPVDDGRPPGSEPGTPGGTDPSPPCDDPACAGRPPGSEPGTPDGGGGDDCEGPDCDDGRGIPPGGDDCEGPDCDDGRPPTSEPGTPGPTDPPPPCNDPSCEGRLVYVVPAAALAGSIEEAGIFLRFPGQWDDPTFEVARVPDGIYYNVHRWYQPGVGKYTKPDPLGVEAGVNVYLYASSNPIIYFDALALQPECCNKPWSDCWGECIEARRLDYWQVIPFSALPKRILPPFRVPDPKSPLTTIPSSIGHLLGGSSSKVGSGLRTAGRFLSRIATPVTIFEGFYDATTVVTCVGECSSDPCQRFLPFSDLFTVEPEDLPFLFE